MSVAQENVEVGGVGRFYQRVAELPDSGARIEDQRGPPQRTSTQGVLPRIAHGLEPGQAMLPRTPQNWTAMGQPAGTARRAMSLRRSVCPRFKRSIETYVELRVGGRGLPGSAAVARPPSPPRASNAASRSASRWASRRVDALVVAIVEMALGDTGRAHNREEPRGVVDVEAHGRCSPIGDDGGNIVPRGASREVRKVTVRKLYFSDR